MDRRESIKALAVGAFVSGTWLEHLGTERARGVPAFRSDWQRWPDVRWTGPAYWGNRLQDWQIKGGKALCRVRATNRTLHCLTHRLGPTQGAFRIAVTVEPLGAFASKDGYMGFRLGAQGPWPDYRSAAVYGEGLDAGPTADGRLFIGERRSAERIAADHPVRLRVEAQPQGVGQYRLTLAAFDREDGDVLSAMSANGFSNDELTGNIALVSHFEGEADGPSARFSNWTMRGEKLDEDPDAAFGPICFAQYTLHRGTLKLTAQLAPIEQIDGHRVALEIKEDDRWHTVQATTADPQSRTAHFRLEGWERRRAVPYRVRVMLPLKDGKEDFFYEGTFAKEPSGADRLKAAVFSCNCDYGFPDAEVVRHVSEHRPHLAVFLGDQFYESTGGFGIQTAPLEEASLDYLRKWYQFGWSYRDLFRDIPAAIIPDDHDVYHGNVWGMAGKEAPTEEGWGYVAQDQGGYKMPPEWVNMVQRTQTSHLPDPYDPTPVKQGIGTYYTCWDYAGVSFAILEDRKFKSAPQQVLPEAAQVQNGFVTNPAFDITEHLNQPDAHLLGERQMDFLRAWTGDWGGGTQMKAVLSQTNFAAVHTLPEGATGDQMVPGLPIPEPGAYVQGDAPAGDMDTNGWPVNRRDEAVRLIREAFAFHIAGDQHLGTVVQYGVDAYEDAGFAFTGPALNNIWPRRWWPPVAENHEPLPGKPPYTGNFRVAFGNRITVHAAANPHQTGREPSRLYDRATGYGIVTFDKQERTIGMACWPRWADPELQPDAQYRGWPVTVRQADQYGREAVAWLPQVEVSGLENPVIEIVDERTGERVYTLRIKGRRFRPKVFAEGPYTIRVGEPDRPVFQKKIGVEATPDNDDKLTFTFESTTWKARPSPE